MIKFQWKVIIALCKIVIGMKHDYFNLSNDDDVNILHDAINREKDDNS